jgi:hypothetical protein
MKKWNAQFGFWQWPCGCIRYQDGYELCPTHLPVGYQALEEDTPKEPQSIARFASGLQLDDEEG